jgi:hypothetical protein
MSTTFYALSLKQPWAALLVHGAKTIEIRSWPTQRRGLILIHASRSRDDRYDWKSLPSHVLATSRLHGGILGSVELTDCIPYASAREFALDQAKHLNRVEWFRGPRLFGFVLRNPRVTPFYPLPGSVKFFPVHLEKTHGSHSTV